MHGKSTVETAAVYGSDCEVKLDIVIGNDARCVNKANKMNHFARYYVINNLYERAFQIKKSRQSVKGKLADSFRPTDPWLVTKDEIADPQNLTTWLDVDGQHYQNGSTKNMVHRIKHWFMISDNS